MVIGPKVTIQKKELGLMGLVKALEVLKRTDVLVGIPQAANSRSGEPVGNAELLYIHTHGSPIQNIPARPVIEPAINSPEAKKVITGELKMAAQELMSNTPHPDQVFIHLDRAGQAGENAAKRWFFDSRNNWTPLKPATIKRKKSSQPLIDTGSMRKAITHVVRQVR